MTPNRYQMLTELKQSIESGTEDWDTLTKLESYFFGEVTSCRCKTATLRSKLNRYWEQTGKSLYEQYGK